MGTGISINHVINDTINSFYVEVSNDQGYSFYALQHIYFNSAPYIYHSFPIEYSIIGESNVFRLFGYDADGDNIFFNIDYGDGFIDFNNDTLDSITRFNENLVMGTFKYSWNKAGKYLVKVQVTDEYDFRSEWKELFDVTVKQPGLIDILFILLEKLGIINT
jgi:hypothetical protein